MRPRVLVFGSVGLVATLVAAVAVVSPATVDAAVTSLGATWLQSLAPRTLVLGGVALLALWGLVAAGFSGSAGAETTSFDAAVETPPESVAATDATLVAASADETVADAVDGDADATAALVDRLRATAVDTYALEADCDRETAVRAVHEGAWTGDDVATALLAPDTPQPLLARFRLWLDPESERERRVRRTLRAIDDLDGGDR